MIFEEKEYVIDDKKVILRSAKPSDAETMITYLKTKQSIFKVNICKGTYQEKSAYRNDYETVFPCFY